jgi:hypothetical protein
MMSNKTDKWLVENFGYLLTADQAASVLNRKSGRSLVASCLNNRCELPLKKLGGRWYVKASDLAVYIDGKELASGDV